MTRYEVNQDAIETYEADTSEMFFDFFYSFKAEVLDFIETENEAASNTSKIQS